MSGTQNNETHVNRATLAEPVAVPEAIAVVGVEVAGELPLIHRGKDLWKKLTEDGDECKEASLAMRERAIDLLSGLKGLQVQTDDEEKKKELGQDIEAFIKDVDIVATSRTISLIVRADKIKGIVKVDKNTLESLVRRYEDLQHETTRSHASALAIEQRIETVELAEILPEIAGAIARMQESIDFLIARFHDLNSK